MGISAFVAAGGRQRFIASDFYAVALAAGRGRCNVGRFPDVIRAASRVIDLWVARHSIFHCCVSRH